MAEVKILYEDKDIIVVVKPAGMASQEERSADMDMVSWLKNYLVREKKVKGMPYIGVIHRLDKPVGGVMVYAKTQQAAGKLSEQVRGNKMTKEYLAVLTGTLPKKEGRLEDMLLSNGKTNRTEVVDAKTSCAKKAVLEYKVKQTKFDEGQQYSLVKKKHGFIIESFAVVKKHHWLKLPLIPDDIIRSVSRWPMPVQGFGEIPATIPFLRIRKAGLTWRCLHGIWNLIIR